MHGHGYGQRWQGGQLIAQEMSHCPCWFPFCQQRRNIQQWLTQTSRIACHPCLAPLVSGCLHLPHPNYQMRQTVETSSEDRCEVISASLYTGIMTPPAKAFWHPEEKYEVWRQNVFFNNSTNWIFILQHSTHIKKKFGGKY